MTSSAILTSSPASKKKLSLDMSTYPIISQNLGVQDVISSLLYCEESLRIENLLLLLN